ncbi:MAG: WecB/TagA/CpsF family glycosyltransferase [Pseudomonadota bacterium]|nr:WecB/TagA/CpsF family glycosyltransferase [Pseudomonadota bacterium]
MKELVVVKQFSTDCLKPGGLYSFMNFASLRNFFESNKASEVEYFCDGMLMAAMVRLVTGKQVERVSFDYTSIAGDVFKYCSLEGKTLYFIGATDDEIEVFVQKTLRRYPDLKIVGYRDGYFPECEEVEVATEVVNSKPDVVVAGLGAGKQEHFIETLKYQGYQGVSFTCGGFIRQETMSDTEFYPKWINKLKLRAFYRMYREPHTIRRYFIDYPLNATIFLWKKLTSGVGVRVLGDKG